MYHTMGINCNNFNKLFEIWELNKTICYIASFMRFDNDFLYIALFCQQSHKFYNQYYHKFFST